MVGTHLCQLCQDLPDPRFIKSWEFPSIVPQEASEASERTKLCLDEQQTVLLPAVDVSQDARMTASQRFSE